MNRFRVFVSVFFGIFLVLVLGLVVAWWAQQTATTATPSAISANGQDLSASPTSGVAPLAVLFSVKRDIGTVQTIDYGDGTSANTSDFICGLQYCTRKYIYKHPGVYTAMYEGATGQVLRSFTISVTANQ